MTQSVNLGYPLAQPSTCWLFAMGLTVGWLFLLVVGVTIARIVAPERLSELSRGSDEANHPGFAYFARFVT